MKKIQMVDLVSQYNKIQEEIDEAVLRVIRSSAFINGPEVKEFQSELENYLGVKHVVPCANGTDALQVAPEKLATPYQIHSADVEVVDESWFDRPKPKVDGVVTKTPGIALGVGSADCCPVLFADPQAGVIGAAHSGWRGAVAGVSARACVCGQCVERPHC